MNSNTLPPKLDVKKAAREAWQLAGQNLLSDYERLMQEAQGLAASNMLNWSARAEWVPDACGVDQVWLHLKADVCVPQICQRCLTPVDVAVHIDRSFRFVESEALAALQDETCDEDVLALSREFDLAELIEDEVLMDLPLVARHELCPVALKLSAADDDFEEAGVKPNPFAVLSKLKN